MADTIMTPTPPTLLAGPYVDIHYSGQTGVDRVIVIGGYYQQIPQIWSIESLYIRLVCDATIANRYIKSRIYPYYNVGDAVHTTFMFSAGPAAASETKISKIGHYVYVGGNEAVDADGRAGIDDTVIGGSDAAVNYISAGVAGDLWSIFLRLKYRNRDLGIPTPYDKPRLGG